MKEAEFSSFLHLVEQEILVPDARFYIWGAGVAGKALVEHLDGESLNIVGFVDSNPEKQAKPFSGFSVIAPEAIEWTAHTKVILASLDYPEGMEQFLISIGKKENKDYFFSNTFLSLYMMSRYKRLYLHHVNVSVTDSCTLRCKDCSFCIPYYKQKKEYPTEKVLAGIDAFFRTVDYVQELHLIGGEPLLYKQLPQLVTEVGEKYRDKIGEFAIATNGSLLPEKELCEACRKYGAFFTISDYRGSAVFSGPSQVDALAALLDREGVAYRVGNKAVWLDFRNPMSAQGYAGSVLEDRFQACFFRNRGLYLDKLYYCQHQYGAVRAGWEAEDPDSFLILPGPTKDHVLAFELGFLPRGYLAHCAHCNGFERLNKNQISGAVQC